MLVPRARAQAAELSDRLRDLGAEPLEAPVIEVAPGDPGVLAAARQRLSAGEVAVLAVTSPNGVDALADAGVRRAELDRAGLVAVVGRGTDRRLRARFDRGADLLPERATTRSLGAAVPAGTGLALLPRADLASPDLPRLLADRGYDVEEVVAYRILRPDALPREVLARLDAGGIDVIALSSPSMVRNLLALVGERPLDARLVSIGPVTTATCHQLGLAVAVEADPHDLDGLVAAIVAAAI